MRKPLLVATTMAATASMLVATSTMALAATPKVAVLTYTKTGGTAVPNKNVISGNLAPATKTAKASTVTLSFAVAGISISVNCTKATFSSKLTADPAKPSTAVTTPTSLAAVSGCTATASQPGLVTGVQSLTFTFPSAAETTFSDAKNLPVTVTLPAKSTAKYAVQVSLSVTTVIGPVTCIYSTTKLSGNYSDTGPELTFSKQSISTPVTGSNSLCPAATSTTPAMTFSAAFGPVNTVVTVNKKATTEHVYVN
jgi:hypothetical protein